MAAETILHSGEFVTQDDELVMVTFYRRTDLNAVPSSMSFGISGGTETLEIWSRTGEAILRINPTYDWLNYQQVSATPIVGTEYHKYTYNIICDANATSDERTGYLDIGIEYGQGVGDTIQVVVTQTLGVTDLKVVPYSISYLPSGGTYGITATWTTGGEPTFDLVYVQGAPDWLTPRGIIVSEGRKEAAWGASPNNTGSSRTAKINVSNGTDIVVVGIVQSSL